MAKLTKEEAYDQLISPLMAQVLAVCMEYHITTIAHFETPTEADQELCITSVLIGPEYDTSDFARGLAARIVTQSQELKAIAINQNEALLALFKKEGL